MLRQPAERRNTSAALHPTGDFWVRRSLYRTGLVLLGPPPSVCASSSSWSSFDKQTELGRHPFSQTHSSAMQGKPKTKRTSVVVYERPLDMKRKLSALLRKMRKKVQRVCIVAISQGSSKESLRIPWRGWICSIGSMFLIACQLARPHCLFTVSSLLRKLRGGIDKHVSANRHQQ